MKGEEISEGKREQVMERILNAFHDLPSKERVELIQQLSAYHEKLKLAQKR